MPTTDLSDAELAAITAAIRRLIDSGVETFICGENGVVYQKDLGPNTAALCASMAQYNPDASWKVVE
jgi:hypothetical protein